MRLKPTRITPPGVDLIELVDARRQCNIDDQGSDDMLRGIIGSVTDYLEAPAGILRVCLLKQTWRESLSYFPIYAIPLSVDPLIEVQKVEYIAPGATTWSEVPADQYEVFEAVSGAWVVPLEGFSWPDTANRVECVRVTYQAGYASADKVPRGIVQAAKLLLGHYFENREATLVGVPAQELPLGIKSLLQPYFRIPV